VLRKLKPDWNPMSFLYKSGQLVAAGAETAFGTLTSLTPIFFYLLFFFIF
jgi:hypothetical protein